MKPDTTMMEYYPDMVMMEEYYEVPRTDSITNFLSKKFEIIPSDDVIHCQASNNHKAIMDTSLFLTRPSKYILFTYDWFGEHNEKTNISSEIIPPNEIQMNYCNQHGWPLPKLR